MMFWVHAHNPCLIEVYLCYVVKLNFHRMFVIKVKKARTVIHTIKKLRKDRQAGLQQGLNSADQYVHGYWVLMCQNIIAVNKKIPSYEGIST